MGLNLIIAMVLAIGAQTTTHEWAPVAISDNQETTLHFVDRTSIKSDGDRTSARIYVVTKSASVSMHMDYDCAAERYRSLEASDAGGDTSGNTRWQSIKRGTPLHVTMRYACSGANLILASGTSLWSPILQKHLRAHSSRADPKRIETTASYQTIRRTRFLSAASIG